MTRGSTFRTIFQDAAAAWMEDNASRLSAALAFYTILSVAPLFLIVLAIMGFVFGKETASEQLVEQLQRFVGEAGAEVAKTAIKNAARPQTGVFASVIGVATLLFGASGVFGELQSAMNIIWKVKSKPGRGIVLTIRDRFLSFGMVFAFGFLLLVSLIATTALTAFGELLEGLVPGLPIIMQLANAVLSFISVTIIFAMIFVFLPDVKIKWRDVWLGAIVTALLFSLGKSLIAYYLAHAGIATPFGAAGSLVAFVVWIYYSGLILFFGAELTKTTVMYFGHQIELETNAEILNGEEAARLYKSNQ